MAEKKLYILHFPGEEAAWMRLDGSSLVGTDAPPAKSGAIILALLPDRFFFYVQPRNIQAKNANALVAAARLQMQIAFPSMPPEWGAGLLRPCKGSVLGFMRRPELAAFAEEHKSDLARAHSITTALVLTWHAAQENGVASWTWEGEEGEQVLAVQDQLHYFRGGSGELDERCRALLPSGEQPSRLALAEVVGDLRQRGQKWSHLRLPMTFGREDAVDMRPLVRIAAMSTLVALLFILGQAARLKTWTDTAQNWRSQTNTLYSQVLGPDLGSDPHGKLLFTLDQLNTGGTQGFDVLGCLNVLSRVAPDSLTVEGVSLSGDSGTISATVNAYDELDKFMAGLKGQGRFLFTLDQATNTDKGVKFNLRVAATK